jgi:hypothetical protein
MWREDIVCEVNKEAEKSSLLKAVTRERLVKT